MKGYSFLEKGKLGFLDKPVPTLQQPTDAIVRVTLSAICSSDLHICHGAVPKAVPGVTLGHELVGVVEEAGEAVTGFKPGDRVAVNCETFCGECFFCRQGYVNNCTAPEGGWALGCRIDGGQAPFVRVPFAQHCLTKIPDGVTDRQALFTGDLLSTGYWACKIADIHPGDTVLVIGGGPAGLCGMLCARLHHPGRIILCERDPERLQFARTHYPDLVVLPPEDLMEYLGKEAPHDGADAVLEFGGSDESFRLAWMAARPNATVVLAAMYERPQTLPLPDMYGKNLVFKTGGVDGCDCGAVMELIAQGKLDAQALITHTFPLSRIAEAYDLFENRRDGVMKVAIENDLL